MSEKNIIVFADWLGLNGPRIMGNLKVNRIRGKEIFAFEYDHIWLKSNHKAHLDPHLQLYTGSQYIKNDQPNFGLFLDSSPDRWGRILMKRKEAILAKKEKRKAETLFEADYLLGVHDEHRMGGLRFKINNEDDFLSADKKLASPPWASLRELEHASLELEKEKLKDEEELKWLNMLIAPGASLGGARPKADIKDTKGNLWIAKFPSGDDEYNIGAWEMVATQIATKAGINVSSTMVKKLSGKHHTFLNQRFDRNNKGKRIHFASAMTLLGYSDGADYKEGVSYLELAEFIIRHGAKADQDLKELWRRIVFNICIKNTDDHLRNHGFLLSENGWILSPVYDVNPVPDGTGLTLNITEEDNSLETELAFSVIQYFRLSLKEANAIFKEIQGAVKKWRTFANEIKIPKKEQDMMEKAFDL
jgi:serine/threonine-protein kinase HipA